MKRTVLIVEDTAANRVLAAKLLHRAGYDVMTAERGADAVTMARERHPDLVLMDLGLPDIDGWQALQQIRNSEGDAASLRVVAFTAHAMVGDRERALKAGFDGYLSKPIDAATFAASVAELMP